MLELPYEITGADHASVTELADAVLAATALRPVAVTAFAAHFQAGDGITTAGIAPAVTGIGPATFYTFGPEATELAEALTDAFAQQGWAVRPMTA